MFDRKEYQLKDMDGSVFLLTGAEPPETEASLPRWTGGDSTMRLNDQGIKIGFFLAWKVTNV